MSEDWTKMLDGYYATRGKVCIVIDDESDAWSLAEAFGTSDLHYSAMSKVVAEAWPEASEDDDGPGLAIGIEMLTVAASALPLKETQP